MRILIAPDKFKGCLPAEEVAKQIAAGIHDVVPRAELDLMPIADGGDGMADIVCHALHGQWIKCRVHDPFGRPIDCRYALIENRKLAVIEMSEAAGMRRITESERNPLRATTFGVGQLILDAARRGAGNIIVGLGGSATNDGGFGLARAFGFRFFDGEGMQVRSAINKLRTLKRIDAPRSLSLPPIIGAADVQNPLLGKHGATRVFGPQKGAGPSEVALLEKCMKRLAREASRQVRSVSPKHPGAGAAGGLGFGLMVFAGAKLRPGFEVVAEIIRAELRVENADIVITGEGKLDAQTLNGKGPGCVARIARQHGKRVFAIVGKADDYNRTSELFDSIYQLSSSGTDTADTISRARDLLRDKAREMARAWKS